VWIGKGLELLLGFMFRVRVIVSIRVKIKVSVSRSGPLSAFYLRRSGMHVRYSGYPNFNHNLNRAILYCYIQAKISGYGLSLDAHY